MESIKYCRKCKKELMSTNTTGLCACCERTRESVINKWIKSAVGALCCIAILKLSTSEIYEKNK